MRKFLNFLFIFAFAVLFVIFPVHRVKAETGNYMRITDNLTPFFSDEETEDLLFYLPYTYYVKILNVKGNIARIEYGNIAVDGYTYIEKLFSDNLTVSAPFPEITIKTHQSSILYKDSSCTSPIKYVFAERTLKYYGYMDDGESYLYYVEYNGDLGFIKENAVYPFTVPEHPNPLTFLPENENPQNDGTNKNIITPFRIIIISCLILAGIIAVFISVKNRKSPTNVGDYYEENDYE